MNNDMVLPQPQDTTKHDIALSQLLVAAEGDYQLVVERYNSGRPHDDHISRVDVLQSFLNVAASSDDIQNAIKASMLISFLEILRVTKDMLIQALPEFEGPALLKTFKEVTVAITSVLPQTQPTIVNQNNVNVLQAYQPEEARNRVMDRLEVIKKMEARYSIPEDSDNIIDQ